MSAPVTVIAYVRLNVDCHDPAAVARDLGISVEECMRLAEIERRRRRKAVAPRWAIDPTERAHVVIATAERICDDHGPYLAQRWELQPTSPAAPPFWGNCPQCDRIWQAEADAKDAAAHDGMSARDRLMAALLTDAGVPDRYRHATLWTWQHGMDQQHRIWQWAQEYLVNFADALQSGRGAILHGAPGTGKTHLAIAILRHVLEKGGTGRYATISDMLSRIKNTYGQHATENEKQAIEAFTTPDLLVIDEVGHQLDTAYELAQFFRIVDKRYSGMKPTILVSNMKSSDLRTFLTEALVDRMKEGGGVVKLFEWGSYRGKLKLIGGDDDT